MIQLEHLKIVEFRGIRSIEIPLNSKSFVVHGPNGSGKSGVVDALDFALTGSIGRLAGAGMRGVSLAKHGPHVHKRDDAGASYVELTVKDTATGKTAKLTRNVTKPTEAKLTPETPEMRALIVEAQRHPELTLSRREIIKYVVSKPADRAQEIQALLQLDKLDAFRKMLKTASGKTSTEYKNAKQEREAAEQSFKSHLGIAQLLESELTREINERRKLLDLNPLETITIDTDLLSGSKTVKSSSTINVKAAIIEVDSVVESIANTDELSRAYSDLVEKLAALAQEPTALDIIRHRGLVEKGIESLESNICPLCDTEWDTLEALTAHLTEKLARSEAAKLLRTGVLEAGSAYKIQLRGLREAIRRVSPIATVHADDELPPLLTAWTDKITEAIGKLDTFDDIVASTETLSDNTFKASPAIVTKLEALSTKLHDMPDQSQEQDARTFLTVAKERWTRVRIARTAEAKSEAVSQTATTVYDTYCTVTDDALSALYSSVEAEFSSYYQRVNSDDEGKFKAQLVPAAGSLDLKVDFYGQGMFPPTAYHSEGHQDGMGVCLYLALVKRLLGTNFRYAVLDDVVMSIDKNHRRQFCELLIQEFPEVQFIITTHDEIWARQMQSAGLVTARSQARFYGWTVDSGPLAEQNDIWERIEADLEAEDVPAAAHKLRRRLEAAAADIADSIGGKVPFHADGNYALSELLDAVKGKHRDLLKLAAASAKSWGNTADEEKVSNLQTQRNTIVPDQQSEMWIINPLVHNNDWATSTVADFRPVLDASRDFLDLFTCENANCGSWINVSGFPPETLRCKCGQYSVNLVKK